MLEDYCASWIEGSQRQTRARTADYNQKVVKEDWMRWIVFFFFFFRRRTGRRLFTVLFFLSYVLFNWFLDILSICLSTVHLTLYGFRLAERFFLWKAWDWFKGIKVLWAFVIMYCTFLLFLCQVRKVLKAGWCCGWYEWTVTDVGG